MTGVACADSGGYSRKHLHFNRRCGSGCDANTVAIRWSWQVSPDTHWKMVPFCAVFSVLNGSMTGTLLWPQAFQLLDQEQVGERGGDQERGRYPNTAPFFAEGAPHPLQLSAEQGASIV